MNIIKKNFIVHRTLENITLSTVLQLPKQDLTLGDVLNTSNEVVEQKNVAQEHVVM